MSYNSTEDPLPPTHKIVFALNLDGNCGSCLGLYIYRLQGADGRMAMGKFEKW